MIIQDTGHYIDMDLKPLDFMGDLEDRPPQEAEPLEYYEPGSIFSQPNDYNICTDLSRDCSWYHDSEPSYIDNNYDGIDDRYQ